MTTIVYANRLRERATSESEYNRRARQTTRHSPTGELGPGNHRVKPNHILATACVRPSGTDVATFRTDGRTPVCRGNQLAGGAAATAAAAPYARV